MSRLATITMSQTAEIRGRSALAASRMSLFALLRCTARPTFFPTEKPKRTRLPAGLGSTYTTMRSDT